MKTYIYHPTFARNALLCVMSIMITSSVFSQTTYYVKTTGSDANAGNSWATAFKTPQKALATAVSGDQIWVAAGTYYPDEGPTQTPDNSAESFILKSGVEIYGGFAGSETSLTQRNWTTNETFLSGDIDQTGGPGPGNSIHVVRAENITTARLDGFIIQYGFSGIGTPHSGAGLECILSSVVIENCRFSANTSSSGHGGAVAISTSLSFKPIFKNCDFFNNSSVLGGAMNISGGGVDIGNCRFISNQATERGGAVFQIGGSNSYSNCWFSNNFSIYSGGAVCNSQSDAVLTNCIFAFNVVDETLVAPDYGGAAISNENLSSAIITNCTFFNNYFLNNCTAPSTLSTSGITTSAAILNWTALFGASGYRIEIRKSGTSTWTQFTINGSATTSFAVGGLSASTIYEWRILSVCAGGISDYSPITSFTTQQGQGGGGGIIHRNVNARNASSLDAYPGNGGVIRNKGGSSMTMTNSIIWNLQSSAISVADDGSSATVSHSDIQDGYPGCSNCLNVDPLFYNSSLANFHLTATSPVINMGTSVGSPSVDHDGLPRDAQPDMGAYEYPCLDVTAPAFEGSFINEELGCNPTNEAIQSALGTASATDACSIPTVTSVDGEITSDGCFKSQTRKFTATDAAGKTSTISRTVTWTEDQTPPIVTAVGTTLELGCNPSAADIDAALGTATATDACSTPTVSSSDGAVSSNGCLRSQTRTFTAKDACDNTTTASRVVTWIVDLTPPTFIHFTGGDIEFGCNSTPKGRDIALGTATATDDCGEAIVTTNDSPITGTCNKSQTRTFTATDASGNTSTISNTVTWIDDVTPPGFTGYYTDVNIGCNPADPSASLGSATATDECGDVSITYSDGEVMSSGCNRWITRTFIATDGCLRTSSASRTVRWNYDKTAPTLTPGGTTLTLGWNPNTSDIEAALGTATATDACGVATVTSSDGSVTGDCLKSQTRTFTAKDACGNTSTVARMVTWKYDLAAPTINCPSNQTVSLGSSCTASLPNYIGDATASDNCTAAGSITIAQYPATGTVLSGTGLQTVTLKATDAAGNTATCSFTVNKVDNTPPVIQNASPGICILSPPNHKMRDVKINYSLTDNCGGTISSVLTVTSDEPINGTGDGDTAPDWEVVDNYNVKLRAERSGSGDGRVYAITIKATDASGNTSTSSVEVRVTHNITSPKSGQSFKVGSTLNFEGEFWDKVGNKHTATWLIDGNTTVKGTVTEPTATKNGKVTGSYKFTAPGVYKLQMNTKDQNNVVSYVNTSGDLDAIIVIYDPNGGYTYGGGYFNSPAGAVNSNLSATGKASYGFSVNYFKGATYPKGETQFEFKVGEFEFNALNFEYMSIAGAKAQMKGTGKIIGGQSGINFILTVTDGQLDGTGIDKIRMKIYNKNTMEVYYDNQPGASDAVNPTTPVQESSTVVISGSNVSNLTRSKQVATKVEQELAPFAGDLQVKAMPNPSNSYFTIQAKSNNKEEKIIIQAVDMNGKIIETRNMNADETIQMGERYRPGMYILRLRQGQQVKQLKLVKMPD